MIRKKFVGGIMNILYIEPFFGGSHKAWYEQVKKHSQHHFDVLSMDARFWKWRMYGGAVTLAENFLAYTKPVDLILVSDMLDLTTFLALCRHKITIPIGIYYHENQFAYPWQENSEDIQQGRDVNYGMMNYLSALVADFIVFNSDYNRNSFFEGLQDVLNKMPDYPHNTLAGLQAKSDILPVGIQVPRPILPTLPSKQTQTKSPLILWNHRLEYDKNPDGFFDLLLRLKADGHDFRLAFLGESNEKSRKNYGRKLDALSDHIVVQGHLTYDEYLDWLALSDLLPVTSIHDFFGISVMEAIAYGVKPLLPKRLSYPDLYDDKKNPSLFYRTEEELYEKMVDAIIHIDAVRKESYAHLTERYWWTSVGKEYDEYFKKLLKK